MNTYIYYFDNEPNGLIVADNWDNALLEICYYYNLEPEFAVNKKGLTFSHSLTEEEIKEYELKFKLDL